jgi:very-short-patch-repair endonuclease
MLKRPCGIFCGDVKYQGSSFTVNTRLQITFLILSVWKKKLVLEVDGGQHDEQAEYDEFRTQQLQAAGFHVLRFWNNEVLQNIDAVKEQIWMAVQKQ